MSNDALIQLGIVSVFLNTSQTDTNPAHTGIPSRSRSRCAAAHRLPASGNPLLGHPFVAVRPAQAAAASGATRRSRTPR